MEIITKSTYSRNLRYSDAELYQRIYSDPQTAYSAGVRPVIDLDSSQRMVINLLKSRSLICLTCFNGIGEFIGTISLLMVAADEGLEIGYAIIKGARRRGYATEILTEIDRLIKEGEIFSGLKFIQAVIEDHNLASISTIEKIGLTSRYDYEDHLTTKIRIYRKQYRF